MPRYDKQEREFGEWSDRIDERENWLLSKSWEWDKHLRFYRMNTEPQDALPEDSVWINYQFSMSRIILPSIYYRNPEVMVSARGDTEWIYADMKQRLINYQLEQLKFETEARKVVFDTLFCGLGVMKLGWAAALDTPKQQQAAEDKTLLQEMWGDPDLEREESPDGEYDDRILRTAPFAIRISPKMFLIDPCATTLDDARWVVHCILKPVDEVKKDRRYSRSLTSGIEATHSLQSGAAAINQDSSILSPTRSKPNEYGEMVMLYEVWDKEHQKVHVLDSYNRDKGKGRYLRSMDWPYRYTRGFPFRTLVFNPDPESPYGIPDVSVWYNPCNAMNLLNTMQFNHVKRFNRKYLAERGGLLPDEMAKLTAPVDGAVALTEGPPGEKVMTLADAPISPDLYNMRETLRLEVNTLSGMTEQRRGGSDQARTATEASLIEQQARIRDSDRLYVVSLWVRECCEMILDLDEQYLTAEDVSFVTGPLAARLWTEKSEEILKADTDVRVRVGSSSFVSKEIRVKQMMDYLAIAGKMVDPMTGMPIINLRELALRIGQAMDIEDLDGLMNVPPPQPPLGMGIEAGMPPPGMMPPGAMPPGMMPPGGGGPPSGPPGAPPTRNGAPNLGNMLSEVQNLGVRKMPNPMMPGGEQ